ncbi:hypothetical protein [Gaiella sp.]
MKLGRLVPLALAGLAAWRRLSPHQKTKVRTTISDLVDRVRGRGAHGVNP